MKKTELKIRGDASLSADPPAAAAGPAREALGMGPEHPKRTPLAEGATIGHYEVIRPLGHGGMGDVYLARDTRLGRRVALKFLLDLSGELSARFALEARATAQLTHENIVALYDIAEDNGAPYMVLEYVPGKTLAAWLKERGEGLAGRRRVPVPPARAAELMLPVVRALKCAHDAGIVHRDLKPANIMLAESGAVKVLDFGIAKLMGDTAPMTSGVGAGVSAEVSAWADAPAPADGSGGLLTQTGGMVGTEAYMAPEQWWSSPLDGRADIWAIGVILFEMVTGEHPMARESIMLVPQPDLPTPSVRERLPSIGRLGVVIDRCLLKDPAHRLGSAQELCDELEAIARPHASKALGEGEELNPYAGLSAFQERDAARFFGREAAVEHIVARLGEQPLLALVGPSGAGKSSLVRAGVIPALKRGGDAWEAFVLRPGSRPLAALAELLLHHSWNRTGSSQSGDAPMRDGTDESTSLRDHDALAARLRVEPGFLGVQMRNRARRRRERALLFVDQFEELYTLVSTEEREAFIACLAGAADDASSPLRVVVSIRQDFLDRVASSTSALAELVSRGTVLVGPLDRRSLSVALTAPAEALAHRFESDALVAEMLDSLAGAASALPILQFTASKLWEGRDRERRVLTEASYKAFGGVSGALASHADAVVGGMSTTEQRWVRMLMLRLVTPEQTRAVIPRSELSELGGATQAELDRVLDRLIEARLLTVEGVGRDESMVELLHESLIHTWPALSRWLEEEQGDAQFRARLRAAAKEWEASHRAEGLLWRGEAEDEARLWKRRQGHEAGVNLSTREATYLAAVVALGDRERRRRRQIVAALFAAMGAVMVIFLVLAIRSTRAAQRADAQAQRAEAQRVEAEHSAANARNATRMAAARERQGDPTTVLALLREIEPGRVPRGWAEFARWAPEAGAAAEVIVHDDEVRSAVFSPDGRRIASASSDKTVRVWSADGSGQPLVLQGHEAWVHSAAFSPDGRRIASASSDKTVRVWNADGSGQPLVLRGHEEVVRSAAFSPDGHHIVSASFDKTVRVWRSDGSGQPLVLRGHEAFVRSAAFSPDGRRIVSASVDTTIRVWNADGSGEPLVLRRHERPVWSAAFSPDGRRIVSASVDKTVRVWNADGSGEPLVLQGHETFVRSAAFSPDGRRIVSASDDSTARVWNADGSGQPLVLRGHEAYLYSAAFSPDGRRIVSASGDKTARIWLADPPGRPIVFRGHSEAVNRAAFSPDGQRIVSASDDASVHVWNADGSGQPLVLRGHKGPVRSAAFSPDGLRIVSASEDNTVRVWNADGSKQPLVLRRHEGWVTSAAFSSNGLRIVSSSEDTTVRVWNADGSGEPLVLQGGGDRVSSAAFSPDGLRIVCAFEDRTVRVWNSDGSGQPIALRGHADQIGNAAFSPDGQRIVSGSLDKTLRVWSADGSGESLVLRGHDKGAVWVEFSPDGRRIVSASDDATVRIWSADGLSEPLVLRASTAEVWSASWSPDGRRVVAASGDKTVILWNDIAPLSGVDDPKLWAATGYCMPLEVRRKLLGFSDVQSRADLEQCQRRVREARARISNPVPTGNY